MSFGSGGRGQWWALLGGITVLGVLEAAVLHWIAAAFLPPRVALVVDVVVGGLTLALLVAFASPLWSRHRLASGVLRLRLGWVAAVDVPLDTVESAGEHVPTATRPAELGAGFDAATGRVSLVRSPASPLVLLGLSRPVPTRVQLFKRAEATSVLVGVDDARALLAALPSSVRPATGRTAPDVGGGRPTRG